MIRIRVEVLVTSPIVLRAETNWLYGADFPRHVEGNVAQVLEMVNVWITQYANFVRRAADELVRP